MDAIDNIKIIWGDKAGRFPFSNSIFVDDKLKTIIDSGAGKNKLKTLSKEVDLVINSHYHLDHIIYNYLFKKAEIIVHEKDMEALKNLKNFATKYGGELVFGIGWVDNWVSKITNQGNNHPEQGFVYDQQFYRSIGRITNTFSTGEVVSFGKTKLEVVHSPGHSEGHCCFFFPSQGLCFATDYNIGSDFGPWYGGADSDINLLLLSAKKLIELDAKYYINSHDQKIYTKKEFARGLSTFLAEIEIREEKIQKYLKKGYSFDDLCSEGIFYKKKYLALDWVKIWEVTMLFKHLKRLNKCSIAPLESIYYRL